MYYELCDFTDMGEESIQVEQPSYPEIIGEVAAIAHVEERAVKFVGMRITFLV